MLPAWLGFAAAKKVGSALAGPFLYLVMVTATATACYGLYRHGVKAGVLQEADRAKSVELEATKSLLQDIVLRLQDSSSSNEQLVRDLTVLGQNQAAIGGDLKGHLKALKENRREGDPPTLHDCVLDDRTLGLLNAARQGTTSPEQRQPAGAASGRVNEEGGASAPAQAGSDGR